MERFLAHLTWQNVAALDKDPGVVILPIGAVEQHGAHLPLLTDTLIANAALEAAFAALPDDVPAWALPTLPFSKSNEHVGFPGTLALSASTVMAVLRDVAQSVSSAGFRRLLFLNAHGGNKALLEMMARDIRAEFGLLTFLASPSPLTPEDRAALPEQEQRFGIHAGTVETALIMATTPQYAHPERATPHYPDVPSETLHLTALPQVAWLSRDWSPTGHFGDPTVATAEDGERWLKQAGEGLAALIAEIASFEVAHGEVATEEIARG